MSHRTDQAFLLGVQYRTDSNLAARQSIYQYQQPRVDLVAQTLDIAGAADGDTVADVGCGNGRYLAALAARRAALSGPPAPSGKASPAAADTGPGHLLAVDMSPGMLAVTRAVSGASPFVADAARLPLRDGSVDVLLAMHMLYHVPDPAEAVREFRHVTRPGGRVIVGLNGAGHLDELRAILATALPMAQTAYAAVNERLTLDRGEELLRPVFGSVTRHDFTSTIVLTEVEPVIAYVRSHASPDIEALVEAVTDAIELPFRIGTHSGCLVSG